MQQLQRKPAAFFRADPQVRKSFDEDELRALGRSVKKRQLHPLLARSDGTLIDGERRWRGGVLEGVEFFDAILTDENLSADQITEIQLLSAFFRAELTGHEKWQALLGIQAAHPDWTNKQLADHLEIDASLVPRLLSPGKCPEAAQEALRQGRINLGHTYAISRAQTPQEQADLLALALGGKSRDEVEKAGRQARKVKSEIPTVRTSRVRVPLSTATTLVLSGPEMSLQDVIEALAQALEAARKASKESLDVRTFQSVMKDKAQVNGN